MPNEPFEIRLRLNNTAELFSEPTADPFDPDSRYLSGIDELAGQMRLIPKRLDELSRLIIRLPQSAITTDAKSTLDSALKRYCAAKIAENQHAIDELRVNNRQLALSAFVIVAGVLLSAVLLVRLIPELETVSMAIAGLVGVAIWVILWEPIYNYTWAWRPNRLDIRVFENLRAAELVIEGE
jgi:hypothetical protein